MVEHELLRREGHSKGATNRVLPVVTCWLLTRESVMACRGRPTILKSPHSSDMNASLKELKITWHLHKIDARCCKLCKSPSCNAAFVNHQNVRRDDDGFLQEGTQNKSGLCPSKMYDPWIQNEEQIWHLSVSSALQAEHFVSKRS